MRLRSHRTFVAFAACAVVLAAWSAAAREGAALVSEGAALVSEAVAWRTAGEVRYEARDALATWTGVAPLEALDLRFDPGDPGALRLEVVVLPAAFDSGNALRDVRARRSLFETERFPEARLVAVAAPGGVAAAPEPGATVAFTLDAELTLHGVTLPYRLEVRLTAQADADGNTRYLAETAFEVSLTAHGMRRPALLALVTDDLVRVSVTAWAHPDPEPNSTTR
jgi:polyisoprenoid-binding protein YceI